MVNLTAVGTSNTKAYIVGKDGCTAGWNGTFSVSSAYTQGGCVYEGSDERLKDFGNDIEVDFEKLAELPKKYFTWKGDEAKSVQVGVSAQKLQKIYPNLVDLNEDTGYLSVSYEKLSVIALAAIDKLYEKIKELESKITE